MSSMTTLRDINNGDAADATDVEFNFNTIENYIASDVVVADGTQAFTAAQTGVAGTASTHLATKGQVDAVLPVGMITAFGGAAAPSGWALCNGASVSSTDPTYVDLFAVIGTTYGDPGSGNFNLPDFRDRTLVGASGSKANGSTGGRSDWELLQHTHTQDAHTHTQVAHYHEMGTHQHGSSGLTANQSSHSHSAGTLGGTTNSDSHTHSMSPSQYSNTGDFGVGGTSVTSGANVGNPQVNTASDSHSHTLNITGSTGSTDPAISLSGFSQNSTVGDTDSFAATNNSTTATNQNAGTATVTTDENFAPYQATNFIIKL